MSNGKLSPNEKKSLMQNFTGYDISPDMVRLSLVNMYLHGFPTPKIYEYDTLTSEDRWNENFDVILANPPFMTPKGGIRPHNRFSVQANRSEVLFVDYIAEHLNLNGRAGIIVPEGIIFQSANAYKALRKMLVENGFLWAVVSLPAGVFQPYSGVKTSILLLDRNIAKRSEDILFVKISNDGYDLGAQRREIAKNDLPEALEVLRKHRNGEAVESELAHIVAKSKISESGDYNLTGDRYRENTRAVQIAYPMVKLGELFDDLKIGGTPSRSNTEYFGGNNLWVSIKDMENNPIIFDTKEKLTDLGVQNSNCKLVRQGSLLMSFKLTVGRTAFAGADLYTNEAIVAFEPTDKINLKYLAQVLHEATKQDISQNNMGALMLNKAKIRELEIPLPPLEIQNQIVIQIEEWQKIIDGAKQVINSYCPTITIDPSWDMVKLGCVCEINPKKSEIKDLAPETLVSFVPMECLNEHEMLFLPKENRRLNEVYNGYTYFKSGDVLVAKVTPCFENGKSGLAENLSNGIGFGSSEFIVLRANSSLNEKFLYFALSNPKFIEHGKEQMSGTGGLRRVTKHYIENYEIPLPTLEIQNQIVKQIEKERQAVESCKSLVEIFEAKIKARIDEVWGKAADER